jgi:ABC-type branched-subunit amino acid transport system substrate-binding protein
VVSEGYHVASGKLNRYTFQPGITDVKSQVKSMAPWIAGNLGKKVTMIFPDFAFGHDHRDYFSAAIKAQGGEAVQLIPIPPTESSFTRYFPDIPSNTDVLYHVMVGPAVLTFVKELGEHFGSQHPALFGSSTAWLSIWRARIEFSKVHTLRPISACGSVPPHDTSIAARSGRRQWRQRLDPADIS